MGGFSLDVIFGGKKWTGVGTLHKNVRHVIGQIKQKTPFFLSFIYFIFFPMRIRRRRFNAISIPDVFNGYHRY